MRNETIKKKYARLKQGLQNEIDVRNDANICVNISVQFDYDASSDRKKVPSN